MHFRIFQIMVFVIISIAVFCCKSEEVKTVKIGICSDVHLPTMHDSEMRITAFIDSMNIAKPDFIIELGDFGIPDERYTPYFDIWNSFQGQKYHVIGNHEMDGGTSLDEALSFRNMKNSYYTFAQNGFQFIVLDGNDKESPDQKGYKSFMGEKQLSWLQNELRLS